MTLSARRFAWVRRRAAILPFFTVGVIALGWIVAEFGIARVAESDYKLVALLVILSKGAYLPALN